MKKYWMKMSEAISDGGLFTDTDVSERGENEGQSKNGSEVKAVS